MLNCEKNGHAHCAYQCPYGTGNTYGPSVTAYAHRAKLVSELLMFWKAV
jgi:hypothetical protein